MNSQILNHSPFLKAWCFDRLGNDFLLSTSSTIVLPWLCLTESRGKGCKRPVSLCYEYERCQCRTLLRAIAHSTGCMWLKCGWLSTVKQQQNPPKFYLADPASMHRIYWYHILTPPCRSVCLWRLSNAALQVCVIKLRPWLIRSRVKIEEKVHLVHLL